MSAATKTPPEASDEAIVTRILDGEPDLYEILMRRHNRRVYRIARSIVKDELEAEDVMQDAYVRAFAHLRQFEGRSSFTTWIGRIAVNEAFARLRRSGRFVEWEEGMAELSGTPEDELSRRELGAILTEAIESLQGPLRLVFVLREIEEMSTEEVADCLGISSDNVKARLHRAKRALRRIIQRRVGGCARDLFSFHLSRCDRIVSRVFAALPAAGLS